MAAPAGGQEGGGEGDDIVLCCVAPYAYSLASVVLCCLTLHTSDFFIRYVLVMLFYVTYIFLLLYPLILRILAYMSYAV